MSEQEIFDLGASWEEEEAELRSIAYGKGYEYELLKACLKQLVSEIQLQSHTEVLTPFAEYGKPFQLPDIPKTGDTPASGGTQLVPEAPSLLESLGVSEGPPGIHTDKPLPDNYSQVESAPRPNKIAPRVWNPCNRKASMGSLAQTPIVWEVTNFVPRKTRGQRKLYGRGQRTTNPPLPPDPLLYKNFSGSRFPTGTFFSQGWSGKRHDQVMLVTSSEPEHTDPQPSFSDCRSVNPWRQRLTSEGYPSMLNIARTPPRSWLNSTIISSPDPRPDPERLYLPLHRGGQRNQLTQNPLPPQLENLASLSLSDARPPRGLDN